MLAVIQIISDQKDLNPTSVDKIFLKILVQAEAMFMHPETPPRLLPENSGNGTSDNLVLVL